MENAEILKGFQEYAKTLYKPNTFRVIRYFLNRFIEYLNKENLAEKPLQSDSFMVFCNSDFASKILRPSSINQMKTLARKFEGYMKNPNDPSVSVELEENAPSVENNLVTTPVGAPIPKMPKQADVKKILPSKTIFKIYMRREDDAKLVPIGEYNYMDIAACGNVQNFVTRYLMPKHGRIDYPVFVLGTNGEETWHSDISFRESAAKSIPTESSRLEDAVDFADKQRDRAEKEVQRKIEMATELAKKMQGANESGGTGIFREMIMLQAATDAMKELKRADVVNASPVLEQKVKALENVIMSLEQKLLKPPVKEESPFQEMMRMKMLKRIEKMMDDDEEPVPVGLTREDLVDAIRIAMPRPEPIPAKIDEDKLTIRDVLALVERQNSTFTGAIEKITTTMTAQVNELRNSQPNPLLEEIKRLREEQTKGNDLEALMDKMIALRKLSEVVSPSAPPEDGLFGFIDRFPALADGAAKLLTSFGKMKAMQGAAVLTQQPVPKKQESKPSEKPHNPIDSMMIKFGKMINTAIMNSDDLGILKSLMYIVRMGSRIEDFKQYAEMFRTADDATVSGFVGQLMDVIYTTKDKINHTPEGAKDRVVTIALANRADIVKQLPSPPAQEQVPAETPTA